MAKVIVMTGSPKDSGFKTKKEFLNALSDYGYSEGKMSKKVNKVDILVTDDYDSNTSKMKLAKDLGVEILTYEDIIEAFDLL